MQGHTVGHAMTGLFSGGDSKEAAPAPAPAQQAYQAPAGEQQNGHCAWEISQFMNCAKEQSDLSLCQGFNEALRQCKQRYGEL